MAAVKALQQWCRLQCEGYRDVSITNMTTSFRDGLAFCALIHRHRPDLINFDSLKKDDVYENNKLAFSVAEQQLGIPALLDAEDMVALRVPDRLSILTYVSQYYNYFHGRSPIGGMAGIKRPAEGVTELQPAGKKNAPVSAKVFPSSGPTKENLSPAVHSRPAPISAPRGKQEVTAQRPLQTGTLSNKCVSCNKHVHLVQRHLVDGKLYHRNCAKALTGNPFAADLSKTSSLSGLAPDPRPDQTSSPAAPSWLTHKLRAPSSGLSGTSRAQPTSTAPSVSPSLPRTSAPSVTAISNITSSPGASSSTTSNSPKFSVSRLGSSFESTTTTTPTPTPAPRTSIASKNLQAKMKFFQTNDGDSGGGIKSTQVIHEQKEESPASHSITLGVQVGAKERQKEKERDKKREQEKEREKEQSQAKTSAAAIISKKLTEENNKPDWRVTQTHTRTPAEVPEKNEVRGRVRLRANPSLLSDLTFPTPEDKPSLSPKNNPKDKPSVSPRSSPGPPKPKNTSLSPAGFQSESPSDWRARLRPVSPDPGPKSSQAQSKPRTNGSNGSHSVLPFRPAPAPPTPTISVTPSSQKGSITPPRGSTAEMEPPNKTAKADYIPQEEILRELQQIEDSLNELERTGVDLEHKLRTSEENGEDESVMNELMVEWFTLIKNKQVAMRRESELVYIGKTQELEEEQPTVEQELRRLLDKPEHLKTQWERRREETLMKKLVEIVNDRNAIVEGLDEDRLREEEEDEQLNQLMMNFNLKKEKSKKKSPMSRLFSWSSKDS